MYDTDSSFCKEHSILVSHEKEEALLILQQKLESTSPITSSPVKAVVRDQAVQSAIPNLSFQEPQNLQSSEVLEEPVSRDRHDTPKIHANTEDTDEDLKVTQGIIEAITEQYNVVTEDKTTTLQESKIETFNHISFIHIGKEPALVEKSMEKVIIVILTNRNIIHQKAVINRQKQSLLTLRHL